MGFIDNDNASHVCLTEASTFVTAHQTHEFFTLILLNCAPLNPRELWDKLKDHLADDILHKLKRLNQNVVDNEEFYNVALNLINETIAKTGNHISNYLNLSTIWTPLRIKKKFMTLIIRFKKRCNTILTDRNENSNKFCLS